MDGEPGGSPLHAERPTRERVREVLGSSGFRRLFAARAVSQFGDGVFQVAAATVLLFDDPGANPAASLFTLTAATLIPFSVVGPFAGVFIDRWDRQKILARVPAARAVVAALLPAAALLGTHGPLFYVDALVVLSANRFFLATVSAALPRVVPADDLLVANSTATTGGSIANVIGLGLGSALASQLGGERTAFIAAAAFALSAIAGRLVPVHRATGATDAPLGSALRAVRRDLWAGARAMHRSRRVRYGMTSITTVQVLVGAMVGVLVYFIIHDLRLGVGSATRVLAVLAIGIGAGVVLVPLVARRLREEDLVPIGFAIAAAGGAIGAAGLTRTVLAVVAGILGVSYAFAKIPVDTIVQEEMRDIVRGRAFAVYDMLFNLARVGGVGTVALAYGWGATSRGIVLVIAVVFATGAIALWRWERRLDVVATGTSEGRSP